MLQRKPIAPSAQPQRRYNPDREDSKASDNDVEIGILFHGSYLSFRTPLPVAQFLNLTVKIVRAAAVRRDTLKHLNAFL